MTKLQTTRPWVKRPQELAVTEGGRMGPGKSGTLALEKIVDPNPAQATQVLTSEIDTQ